MDLALHNLQRLICYKTYDSNRNVLHLNNEQINDFFETELWEIDLFDHLTVSKHLFTRIVAVTY